MKPRTSLYVFFVLLLIALGGIWYFSNLPEQNPNQIFPATVNRDCAPWDGAAFTVMVQYDPTTVIYISIWRSPDMKFQSTFSFPDESGQVGNAYILPELGPYTLLSGEISFERVEEGTPLEGGFRLTSARGEVFEGGFTAEWGDQVVYCG